MMLNLYSFTADCVIFSPGGKLLVIRRKYAPFQGMLALPGGFVNLNETVEQAAIRELEEETGLQISVDALKIVGVYSKPDRDPRGRIITTAFTAMSKSTLIKADDDADSAMWVSADWCIDYGTKEFAFDHAQIVEDALNLNLNNRCAEGKR